MSLELFAFLIAAAAGLTTLLGAALAIVRKEPSARFLAAGLAFAAVAMLLISFLELIPESAAMVGLWPMLGIAALGVGAIGALHYFAPANTDRMKRTGFIVAAAVALHNIPEGAAPFIAIVTAPESGLLVAAAIALHNIPEGLAIAAPLVAARVSRWKIMLIAGVAGLAEVLGAALAWMAAAWMGPWVLGALLAGAAGMMIWLSLFELLPAARRVLKGAAPAAGAALSIAVVGGGLLFFT
jgi:zinc transporter, ZIP family